ncbi:MAG: hypothetical protein OQL19_22785 [Gammaproteobacteria bacterium]|nr:hypothetical protein [Gammaproteobacteria bacterium]
MTNTKTTDNTNYSNPQKSHGEMKSTPDNLTQLNSSNPDSSSVSTADIGAKDLNFRLMAMESELHQLSEHLDSSHQSLHQILIQKSEETHSEVNESQVKINHLEQSYEDLEKKSVTLAQETARLTLLLSENAQKNDESIHLLEDSSIEKFNLVSKQIKSLDDQVLQLVSDYIILEKESELLKNDILIQTSNLSKSFSKHEGDFKKLAQDIEVRNKKVDSTLEQVGRNFSFHDTKILKLHEKDTELNQENDILKQLLKQTDDEHRESVVALEKNLKTKIATVSDESVKQYQVLNNEQKNLDKRTAQVESKNAQLDIELQKTEQKQQKQLAEHDKRLALHNTNIKSHETRLGQLKSVDEELKLRAEGLKKTTERLDEHSGVLEKTTVVLRDQSQELQKAVIQLDKQNEQLDKKTDQLGIQIATNVQQERQHFQTMTMAISIVAILTTIVLIYSFINQQSLWQSSMDNDVVIERRMNVQLSEQSLQMTMVKQQLEQNRVQAEQQRDKLTQNIEVLQAQLKAEQERADSLLKASQDKNRKIVQLKGEIKEIDDNVQFLNTSVGPLKDYARNTGKQSLHDDAWLAQQSGEHFAIQLISVDSKQALYQFVEQQGFSLQDELAWFTINSKGKDYYILTYGNFEELSQANAALTLLPSFVTEKSPGIARMKDIQSFIH